MATASSCQGVVGVMPNTSELFLMLHVSGETTTTGYAPDAQRFQTTHEMQTEVSHCMLSGIPLMQT